MASQPTDETSDGTSSPPANGHTALPREASSYSQLLRRAPKYLYDTTKTTLFFSKANLLLPFVPLSIIAANLDWSPVAIFTLSFLAIFPLAELLSWSTEQLSASTGQTIGGLLNATFGNAVEMIVSFAFTSLLNVSAHCMVSLGRYHCFEGRRISNCPVKHGGKYPVINFAGKVLVV